MTLFKKIERSIFPCQKEIDTMMEVYQDKLSELGNTVSAVKRDIPMIRRLNELASNR